MIAIQYFCAKEQPVLYQAEEKGFVQVVEAVLHFLMETRAVLLLVTRKAIQLKVGEIAETLGIEEIIFFSN